MYKRSSFGKRFRRRGERRQNFIFYLYKLFCFFGNLTSNSSYKGYRVSDVVCCLADRYQNIPIFDQVPYFLLSRQVFGCIYSHDTVKIESLRRVYGFNHRTRVLRTERRAVYHAVKVKVCTIFGNTQNFVIGIVSRNVLSYCAGIFFMRDGSIFPEHFCSEQYCLFYLFVSRTAAYIIFYGVFNLFFCRVGNRVNQPLRRDHHSRNAKTTLHRSGVGKSV